MVDRQQRQRSLRRIWSTFANYREQKNSLALTRVLTDYEAALEIKSPKGLLVHGDVGTGKSMLIDLFAESLPNRKKRRWHFNTFMLDIIYRLEQLRKAQNSTKALPHSLLGAQDYPLLKVAKDLIQNSPILFLDEFQMPDRTSSKILSTLLTSFFNLGGVLIATSNRMPDELAKAGGLDMKPQLSGLESLKQKMGFTGMWRRQGDVFSGAGDFQNFVQLLKARCDVWVMNSETDYRRLQESEDDSAEMLDSSLSGDPSHVAGSDTISIPNLQFTPRKAEAHSDIALPRWYYLTTDEFSGSAELQCDDWLSLSHKWSKGWFEAEDKIVWKPIILRVYGREIKVPHNRSGVAFWTFAELCQTTYGPADYTTMASSFHTFVIFQVPILTWAERNEARRFITLLDALYEARCKLMILATASPDTIFFPDMAKDSESDSEGKDSSSDALHSETFAEAFQDATAPFRPNISSYGSNSSDSLYSGRSDTPASSIQDTGLQKPADPNFSLSGAFVGEDELFAYKRARSRIWEMCSKRWWDRTGENWWRPLPAESRFWEKSHDSKEVLKPKAVAEVVEASKEASKDEMATTSPFRTHSEPPPRISWTHIWGTMKWGNRAGIWGQGPDGLQSRKKRSTEK